MSFRSFSIILQLYVHLVIALWSKLDTIKIDPAELQMYELKVLVKLLS